MSVAYAEPPPPCILCLIAEQEARDADGEMIVEPEIEREEC